MELISLILHLCLNVILRYSDAFPTACTNSLKAGGSGTAQEELFLYIAHNNGPRCRCKDCIDGLVKNYGPDTLSDDDEDIECWFQNDKKTTMPSEGNGNGTVKCGRCSTTLCHLSGHRCEACADAGYAQARSMGEALTLTTLAASNGAPDHKRPRRHVVRH